MSALSVLRAYGQMTAAQVAEMLGRPIEDVYRQLVAAEAKFQAEVVIRFDDTSVVSREWSACGVGMTKNLGKLDAIRSKRAKQRMMMVGFIEERGRVKIEELCKFIGEGKKKTYELLSVARKEGLIKPVGKNVHCYWVIPGSKDAIELEAAKEKRMERFRLDDPGPELKPMQRRIVKVADVGIQVPARAVRSVFELGAL